MQAVRLSVADAAVWFSAHPHPNVLEPMAHAERKRYVGLRDAGGDLVASATLQKRALGCCQVGGIFVVERRRGAGIGRILMAAVRAEARAWGCRWLALGSYRRAPDVSPFYRAVGFWSLVPYIPGAASRAPAGAVARTLAWLFRVEAGPHAIRLMVAKA